MDFTRDPQEFSSYLNIVKRDWGRASQQFTALVEHWQSVTAQYYPDLVEIGPAEEPNIIKGKVLGKSFLLELNPCAKDKIGYAEVVLSTNKPGYSSAELGRFHFLRDGSAVGIDGTVLADPNANLYSYGIFTSILQAVLEASATLRN
ncbi:hypothetical protein SRABI123_01398 [Pseudomonas sp. Bi123]|uniref:hypothetical protein n=1 Tax=Pseudomonas sp. Bi123 TaxID=2821121 RepID=UPI001D654650|nr:hypothetical protein [Pseudomonas sp. Bi123]CAH0179388.1 hypothetical protein SRABI123_01398 [Pseudomonas sp. Bi123]